MHACMLSHFSHVQLFVTLWTVGHQALCSWDSPGKNTGAGCHVLLQKKKKNVYMCVCVCVCVCVCIERETERDTERQRERQRKRKISNHHHNSTLECLHHSHKISLSSSGGHAFLLPQIVFLSLSLFFCLF